MHGHGHYHEITYRELQNSFVLLRNRIILHRCIKEVIEDFLMKRQTFPEKQRHRDELQIKSLQIRNYPTALL